MEEEKDRERRKGVKQGIAKSILNIFLAFLWFPAFYIH